MNRRTYIEGLGAVAATGALAGCTGDGNGSDDSDGSIGTDDTSGDDDAEYGLLSTSITDQPNDIDHFESLVVTIDGIWVKPDGGEDEDSASGNDDPDGEDSESDPDDEAETDGETADQDDDGEQDDVEEDEDDEEVEDVDQSSGRYYIEFDEPQEADLVDLQGAETQLIDETDLAVGEYQFLQLDIAETNGVLTDGEEANVETPGNAPLQFKHAFEIRSEERTRFIADFAPFQTGRGQRYRIRPVATGTQVLYGDEEYDGGDDGDADEDDASDDSGNDAEDSGGSPEDSE